MKKGDILLHGAPPSGLLEDMGTTPSINPGSISLPKGTNKQLYIDL